MLQVVAPYVAEMLHLKWLTINRVAGVAGFQTMSTFKTYINSLPINVIAVFFLVLCALHHFTASLWRDQPAGRTSPPSDTASPLGGSRLDNGERVNLPSWRA